MFLIKLDKTSIKQKKNAFFFFLAFVSQTFVWNSCVFAIILVKVNEFPACLVRQSRSSLIPGIHLTDYDSLFDSNYFITAICIRNPCFLITTDEWTVQERNSFFGEYNYWHRIIQFFVKDSFVSTFDKYKQCQLHQPLKCYEQKQKFWFPR